MLAKNTAAPTGIDGDPNCLAALRDYRSLMPLAQEARKPMFHLQSADGALGAHLQAVARSREDFHALAMKIAHRAGLALPTADGR